MLSPTMILIPMAALALAVALASLMKSRRVAVPVAETERKRPKGPSSDA